MGFSIVSLMCIGWLLLPFKSPEMIWALGGKGLRTTITLAGRFDKILDNFADIKFMGMNIPIGTMIFFGILCFFMWLFLKSKTGAAMLAAGDNPKFATASGINVNRQRTIGTMLSMILGGIGILVYAQSFGFFQLYQGPLMMPFIAISAILIGGATARKATISNVISGVVLFQALLTIALPVINKMTPEGNLSEVIRIIVQNGVILYALTKVGGND
jgi:simple sugar transport system permease protein